MMQDSHRVLEQLFETAHQRAWRLAYSLLRDAHAAFDCVQQAYLVAARNPGRIPDGDAWPWFAVVVGFEARNIRRKRRPATNAEGVPVEEPQSEAPGLAAQRVDDSRLLWQALDALPQEERQAIVLTHVNGLTHALAAQALGLPEKTVSSQVARGMERLRGKLKSREDELGASLAALPVIDPPGGYEAAAAAWKAAASSVIPVATGAVIVGGAVMGKYLAIAACVVIALGVGLAGGYALKPSAEPVRETPRGQAEVKTGSIEVPVKEPAPGSAPVDDAAIKQARKERDDARSDADKMKKHADTLEKERSDIARENERLKAELQPYRDAEALRGPTFTFGESGKLEAIREADWKEMAQADSIIQQCLIKIYEHGQKGERAPDQVYIDLQENTEKVRKYEYRTIRKMPTAAEHNGELTNPISMANLLATTLKLAGKPLNQTQVSGINALGEQFDADFAKFRAAYTENTLRTQKMLDEFLLKDKFRDEMLALLDAEQHVLVVDTRVFKIAYLDLHDVTLMIIHTSPIIGGASAEEISGKLADLLVKRYGLSDAQKSQLAPILGAWVAEVTPLTPCLKSTVRYFNCAQGAQAGAATVRLLAEMLNVLGPTEEQRRLILNENGFFIPRLVQ
ncbi:ECF RNA polymerase sigma factor SigE [Planctomycetaceae bacterium]|nr:ECF RNA polymerase sigma factor SigE [Planctomycetaceae bacterium]